MKDPIVHDDSFSVRVSRPDEIAAAAVGLLVLKAVETSGRTRLFERAIENALERVTSDLDAEEMMRLEVEAHEILDWLVGDSDPLDSDKTVASRDDDVVRFDPDASIIALLRESMFQGFDVRIAYFTRTRSEVNQRVITPTAIAADRYVRAWCHARRAQRVFRIDRITHCIPVDGVPFRPARPPSPPADEREESAVSQRSEDATTQLSLLDD